jgi:lipopolysaccharide/colanic/teichoic acid biosynthesis glycosyltransferase
MSSGVAALGISLSQLLLGSAVLPRYVVLGTPALLIPIAAFCSALARDGHTRAGERERVVAVAGIAEGIHLTDELAGRPERPAVLALVLSPAVASGGPGTVPLVDAVRRAKATTLVLDRTAQADETIVAQAAQLHEDGVRVRTLSLFYDEWLGKLPLSELERISLLFDIGELHQARYGRLKRLMDIGAALVGLVGLALVIPMVWIGNLVANPGPLFYSQPRVGKNGRIFQILKLRSMRPSSGPTTWTADGDLRVTRFGAWLRRTHIDELPQVLNILRGDLSVVGPRPEQPKYVDELTDKIPFYRLRHLVRPGLTGWAQVKYSYGATQIDAFEKLQYEFFYLRHQSLRLDLRIIVRTVRSVIGRAGR